jgi:Uma2 family endonuclease
MALPQAYVQKDNYTEDEYFAYECAAFGRWEYVNGEIRAMAGGTDDHNTIAADVGRAPGNALAPCGCRLYGSGMKVHTADGVNTFPDVSVVCGARHCHRGKTAVMANPVRIVEVLSDSTRGYDRGEKLDHYKTIATLTDSM